MAWEIHKEDETQKCEIRFFDGVKHSHAIEGKYYPVRLIRNSPGYSK